MAFDTIPFHIDNTQQNIFFIIGVYFVNIDD